MTRTPTWRSDWSGVLRPKVQRIELLSPSFLGLGLEFLVAHFLTGLLLSLEVCTNECIIEPWEKKDHFFICTVRLAPLHVTLCATAINTSAFGRSRTKHFVNWVFQAYPGVYHGNLLTLTCRPGKELSPHTTLKQVSENMRQELGDAVAALISLMWVSWAVCLDCAYFPPYCWLNATHLFWSETTRSHPRSSHPGILSRLTQMRKVPFSEAGWF